MFESLLITFRETLEAALVVFIVVSYLKKINQSSSIKVVILGVLSAIGLSIVAALFFTVISHGLQEEVEEIFEGTVMILAAVLLTTMIMWMARATHVRHQLESRVHVEISDKHTVGLFAIVFLAVLREGIETVIFLGAAILRGAENSAFGGVLGVILAITLGYGIFYGAKQIQLKTFFRITSLLLIFFAAGLLAHGVHEFQEAGLLPFFTSEAWNINPQLLADGSFPLLHEKGTIGSIFKGVFGYNGNPSVLEVGVYLVYFVVVVMAYGKNSSKSMEIGLDRQQQDS